MAYKKIKDEIYTTRDLIRDLGITRQAINEHKKKGMPHEKISNRVTEFNLNEVLEWRENNVQKRNFNKG